ncbi:MAG: transposase [Alphaproteobacteria bacterium]|nr:transposase [Alphaproteobacteria bacterium]
MSDVDTSEGKRRRHKRWPEALKREIVAATLAPGASVSVVARQYDVNANQVFMWRRRYRGAIEHPAAAPCPSAPALVPVTITPAPEAEAGTPAATSTPDTIEIEVCGDCRVRVGSGFDVRALKRVLDLLRRR